MSDERGENMRKKETLRLTITAIFMAILLLQSFIPNIGYVRILPTLPAITLIPLTIALYGSLMGAKAGLFFGLFWGLTRLFLAYTQPGDPVSLMLFQNPVISILPSVLSGFFAGLVVDKLKTKKFSFVLAGLIASLTNTIMVILLTTLFFMNHAQSLMKYLGNTNSSSTLFLVLLTAFWLNGILEAIFTGVITPIIALPLNHYLRKIR